MRLIPVWLVSILLSACAYDPIDNPGTWRLPQMGLSSNDENLRAMLVNPRDLVAGAGDPSGIGVTSARAAQLQLKGQRPALPIVSTESTGGGGAGGAPAGGGAGAGGGQTE